MRICNLVWWDIKFQIKYGFYFLYTVLTILYLAVLSALPEAWRQTVATVLIYSDPAAMGLFFMGAIVLLEKSQRIPCALAVSPVKPAEYIASKLISLSAISLLVAAVLAGATGTGHRLTVLLGTFFSGAIFTLLGVIIATKIESLNQFILWTVPIEILGFAPAILHLAGVLPSWLRFYPANICIDMVAGEMQNTATIGLLAVLIAVLWYFSCKCVGKMWNHLGGMKL